MTSVVRAGITGPHDPDLRNEASIPEDFPGALVFLGALRGIEADTAEKKTVVTQDKRGIAVPEFRLLFDRLPL